jgi:hypothetical protein
LFAKCRWRRSGSMQHAAPPSTIRCLMSCD